MNLLVYLAAERGIDKKLKIIITSIEPHNAIQRYNLRDEIEHLFCALKTRDFCFENTHMTNSKRISKLIAAMAVTFA
ncbi:MAG: hypothetical protein GY756_25595 [bacterium]|nr:hypothetical protein [bacterium]